MADIFGLIGSGIGALSNIYTNQQNIRYQQQANEQNIQLQREINQQNIDEQWKMWEATNKYNSPVEQMARYRAAGLNPNLIYGQSNTAQSMNVGTASAPQVQSKKVDYNQMASIASSYLSLLSQKKAIEKQDIENKIAGATYDDIVKQSHLNTQHLEKMLTKVDKEIESIGLENTFKLYENQLKAFEVDMLPIIKQLKQNELSLSNSQVDLIPTAKLKAQAELRLTNVSIGLTKMKQALTSAQTSHELAKLGLTKSQKDYYLQQINESLARVEKINLESEDQAFKNSNPHRMSHGILGSISNFGFGISKNVEQIINSLFK